MKLEKAKPARIGMVHAKDHARTKMKCAYRKVISPPGRWSLVVALALGCAVVVATGCIERRVEYVPAYQPQPGSPAPPGYAYQPQGTPQTGPGSDQATIPAASGTNPPLQQGTAPTQPSPPGAAIVSQAPPPPQVEVVPVAPGPDYVWTPGYWGWNGGWVWVSGNWALRPHFGAVWVGGHWARRGRGYIWIGGGWR